MSHRFEAFLHNSRRVTGDHNAAHSEHSRREESGHDLSNPGSQRMMSHTDNPSSTGNGRIRSTGTGHGNGNGYSTINSNGNGNGNSNGNGNPEVPVANEVPLTCCLPDVPSRDVSHITNKERARMISLMDRKWVNGTLITYYFFQDPPHWKGGPAQEDAVRDAFQKWKDVEIGLNFKEVLSPLEAIAKITFDHSDGSWSYMGRDCIDMARAAYEPTTNFGWDLTTNHGRNTALHEVGHILGLAHEHQNPMSGIVWNVEKVLSHYMGPPNFWREADVRRNILHKLPVGNVVGSNWDKDSVMHYSFDPGLIESPSLYKVWPLLPLPGLSKQDITTIRELYPMRSTATRPLELYRSDILDMRNGENRMYIISVSEDRQYTIRTFGRNDTVLVLFEMIDGLYEQYYAADDDSGTDKNALISVKLFKAKKYHLRVRLSYAAYLGAGSIMLSQCQGCDECLEGS